MKSLSPKMWGGLIGILYLFLTYAAANIFGGDPKGAMVIFQITNIHLSLLFIPINKLVPVFVASSLSFQFIVGVIVNFFVGSFIGWFVGKVRKK